MDSEITIVTGFFKINREDWKGFAITDKQYLSYFKVWAKLKNKIIVYVETEEMRNEILSFRDSVGLLENTVVNVIPNCTSLVPQLFDSIRIATEHPTQKLFRLRPSNPEVWNCTYNYIMLLKAWCVCDSIDRGQASGMIAWVDFGYNHGGNPISPLSDFNYLWKYDFPDKINLFTIQEPDNRPIFDIVFSMDTYIMGGVLVAPDHLWHPFWEMIQSNTAALNICGLSDDDQNVFLMCYRQNPSLFALHKSYWSVQLKQFGGDHLIWTNESNKTNKGINLLKKSVKKARHLHQCILAAFRIGIHYSHLTIH